MEKIDCNLRFLTPAFLGDAEQHGAWRSPPFKALLRQWWRVAAAPDYGYDHVKLREAEGRLFGHAWLGYQESGREKSWASQGRVRMRLGRWEKGSMNVWPPEPRIKHPEVPMPVGAHLYLAYGPLNYSREQRKSVVKNGPAIGANEENQLLLGLSAPDKGPITEALQLIHWFGTLGGRSRNGWGSLALGQKQITDFDQLLNGQANRVLEKYSKSLNQCLAMEWPHALGTDQKNLLLWKTKETFPSWSDAIKVLAQTKIDFRTSLKFTGSAGPIVARHLLAYPVTKHSVASWGNQSRLANQLRFKVVQQADKRYVGLAFHLPCGLPRELLFKLDKTEQARLTPEYQGQVWQQVHRVLDQQMTRIQGGR